MAAQVHLDLISPNFGIQEFTGHPEVEQEVFPGCPWTDDKGYVYVNDKPGFGVDINEELAKKYPNKDPIHRRRMALRLPDGTSVRP
jgi:mannonate dehydratase